MRDDKSIQNVFSYIPARASDEALPKSPDEGRVATLHLGRGLAAWEVLAAHAVTLLELGVIDEPGFAAIARSIDSVQAVARRSNLPPRALLNDLVERVDATVPGEFAGAIVLGLAREEWLATTSRLVWRSTLEVIQDSVIALRRLLVGLATTHAITVMPAFVGGRATQPTNLGHLLGGVISPLQNASARLDRAMTAINRSPLGAGMLAGEVIAPDRERQAVLLGFSEPITNTFDAVMSVEDHVEAAEAIASAVAPARRFLAELVAWVRSDPASFMLTADWQTRPEPVNPLLNVPEQIELVIQQLGEVEDRARTFVGRLREAAYGPVGAMTGSLLDHAASFAQQARGGLLRVGELLTEGVVVNRAFLGNRAGRSYTTGGDLAAFLMTEEALPPTSARAIAAMVLGQIEERNLEVSGISQDMIDSAAMMTIGREIKVEMETLGRYLAPRRFLERRLVLGSPAASPTRDWLASEGEDIERDARAADVHRELMDEAVSRLQRTISEAAAGDE